MRKKCEKFPFSLKSPPNNWMELLHTLAEFEQLPADFIMSRSVEERWAAMERMRQIKQNYKPGDNQRIPVMEQINRKPNGTEIVCERWLRTKDGTVLSWKYPSEPLEDVLRKYYP